MHIRSSFNNTMITVTDMQGNALSWASSGEMGFRAPASPLPLPPRPPLRPLPTLPSSSAASKSVEVYVKGPGQGREAAIRALQAVGLEVTLIKDVTPVPHNGCRPPKRRRV